MGVNFSCVKCVDVSYNGENLQKKQKRKKKEKTIKTSSYQDQTSQQVTCTSAVEVLIVAEDPGHVQVDDEWSDAAFQALVGDSSEWGADVINSLSCVYSVGVLQATVCATSDDSVPVQDVAYYRANVPRVPARDVADCSVDVPQVPVSTTSAPGLETGDCCFDVPPGPDQDVADYSVDVPQVPVSTTSAPGLETGDCCFDVPPVPDQDVADCSVDVPQVPVSTTSAPGLETGDCCFDVPPVPVCAISDSSDDLPPVTFCVSSSSSDDLRSVPASPWAIEDCECDLPPIPACSWATSDSSDDLPPVSAWSISDCFVERTSQLKQLEENEIINVGSHSYKIVRNLGGGSVYAGIRLTDGLEVALKIAGNVGVHWMRVEDCTELVPKEIALLIRAKKGIKVPEIIQLLDWVVEPERYVMVLEYPTPCEDLDKFLCRHNGIIEENMAKVIMCQATLAAQICCRRGVLHRGIKPENLLINPNSLDVKLIDFGCGEILSDEGYTIFAGTIEHCPPEYITNGEYHGKPATVWSLGLLMFRLLQGRFPEQDDLDDLNDNNWVKDGLSQECSELLCCLLQINPETRLELDNICVHDWFTCSNNPPEDKTVIDVGLHSYEIVRMLGQGGFGSVYAGIRLTDGLEVALKFADIMGTDWIYIEDCPEPVPKEIALLILAKKGIRIPEIIQLLDWVVEPERYIMVLEYPTPCEDLIKFLCRHNGIIEESIAKVIMCQATLAAQMCCRRGVLHRDVKLENLLINPDSLDVKLIDFGCGEILSDEGYTSFAGTKEYCPPEYITNGEYHGKPATVWSLGILMFTLLQGRFPEQEDLDNLNDNNWVKDGLSQECCELLCGLLRINPETRLELDNICVHNWFN
ncbi:uncharacterized protein LOC120486501 [Pimephales promelas]|uniref:uncharacterized protein LOC120486501 n=1 Tax=Pimephales promelas TaxID=90988 RepID=UPI001955594E|nr:uncharacterized protein LOC120486501 [Pimephales promelas]KAG1945792.1 serine/threonine-protein kinase pim-3-like [Pimephales promelas]